MLSYRELSSPALCDNLERGRKGWEVGVEGPEDTCLWLIHVDGRNQYNAW